MMATHYNRPYDRDDYDDYAAPRQSYTAGYSDPYAQPHEPESPRAYPYSQPEHSHGPGMMTDEKAMGGAAGVRDSQYSMGPPPKGTGMLRQWRKQEKEGLMMRGGRVRCCGRWICCAIVTIVVLIVGIIASILLYIRPPNISFNGVKTPESGQQFTTSNGVLQINFDLDIGVTNPNAFGVNFNNIHADLTWPSTGTDVGYGQLDGLAIDPKSNKNFRFPFHIQYTPQKDSNFAILKSLATDCGILGGSKSNIDVDYKIKLGIQVLGITISPSFSSSTSIACPDISESDLSAVVGNNVDLGSLLKQLTGSTGTGGGAGTAGRFTK